MMKSSPLIIFSFFFSFISSAQNCNNWLSLPFYPSYVAIGDLDIPGNQLTVEAEINLTEPYGGGPYLGSDIVGKYADPSDVNYLLRAQNAQITTTDGFFQTPEVCELQTNKTYYVAMVYDGTFLKFYRNGFLLSQVAATGNLHQNDWITQLGFYQFAFYNVNLIGYMNEVRIWNVARTQVQLQTYMHTSLPSPTTQPGLLAYYTFDDLLNKQGTPSWNGSLGGSAAINKTNPSCAAFVADNYCCPSLTGTFTGSTTCSSTYGMLTFHCTSGSKGPFKLVYQDPVSTAFYWIDNIQDGVPFPTDVVGANTTVYNLVSIQDQSSGCIPTNVSGPSATIIVDDTHCNPCSNWLGLPGQPSYFEAGNLNVPGNQLTVEAEINRTTPYTQGTLEEGDIVSKHDNPTDVNYLLRPNHAYITTSDGYYGTPDICDISLNKTYHVAMVYDGTSLKFYRNGFLMSQVPATGNLIQNNWMTRIGYYFSQAYNENFIGYINEVRIWNVARTQAQIQTFMNSSLPSPAAQTGLMAYYVFNDLLNKQGNAAWNGILGGSAAIGQTNPNCTFIADNECCPPVQGTFSGNSICPGQTGLLTFQTTSTPVKDPYTLTYVDKFNTYSQVSVMDNQPFSVAVNPSVTTQYLLLKITDAGNCTTNLTGISATITIFQPAALTITPDTSICNNASVQLNVSGGSTYSWSPAALLSNPNISNPIARPALPTKFYVNGKDLNNCSVSDSVSVGFLPVPVFNTPPDGQTCAGIPVVLNGNNDPKFLYSWSPAAFLNNPNAASPQAMPDQTTDFNVKITDPVCAQYNADYNVHVVVNPTPAVVATSSNDIDCSNLTSQLSVTGASVYSWLPAKDLSDPESAMPVARLAVTTHFTVTGTNNYGCSSFDSVTVVVTKTGENAFSVPNAFTPNGDNRNDCFGIRSWGNVTLQDFAIYNRWGQKLFETKNPGDCWDGTFHGEKQPEGGYVYLIKASSFCGNIVRKGNLLLIR